MFTNSDLNHAEFVSDIIEACGLTPNTASITAAYSALSANVHFQIGEVDSTSLPTYADIAAKVLGSTVGFITPNTSGEIEYNLFQLPNPSTTADDVRVDPDTFNDLVAEIEYQDIYSSIVSRNDLLDIRWLGAEYGGGSTGNIDQQKVSIKTNDDVYYLHGIEKIYNHACVLDDVTTTDDIILSLISSRKVKYRFVTASKNLDHYIGRDLYLVTPKALGGTGFSKVKLLANTVNGKQSQLICFDLLGLER